MGEEHPSRVEVRQPVQPRLVRRERGLQAVVCGAAGQVFGREVGSGVVCLACEEDCAVVLPEDQ